MLNTANKGRGQVQHSVAIQGLGDPETLSYQLGQRLRKEGVDLA